MLDKAREKIKNINKIFLSTDYDADGISCSVVGTNVLWHMKKDYRHLLYNNEYPRGVHDKVIDVIISKTTSDETFILLTADHGSSDMDRFNRLKKERPNAVIIMTDHHLIEDEKALEESVDFVINPQYTKCNMNKAYSGCNVLYKLLEPFISNQLEEKLLPIVAMANLIDQMDMGDKENRETYHKAIPFMKRSYPFQKLLQVTRKTKMHDRWIMMNVGPLINSTHRLGSPEIAFKFLSGEVDDYIEDMIYMNKDRKSQTNSLYTLLSKQVQANSKLFKNVMILLNPTESTSFNGLVAGRIGNEINKPTFVLTRTDKTFKGSARAIQKIPLMDILEYISSRSDCIEHCGGHHAACGIALKKDASAIKEFNHYFEEYLKEHNIVYTNAIEAIEIKPTEILSEVYKIEEGRPYGQGNPYPVYKSTFTIRDVKSYSKLTKVFFEETEVPLLYFKSLAKKRGDNVTFTYTIEIDKEITLMADTLLK